MTYLTNNRKVLLTLLREALFGSAPDSFPTDGVQWAEVMEEAKEQAVLALVFEVLARRRTALPKETVLQVQLLSINIHNANRYLHQELVRLHKLLSSEGLHYVVVKGAVAGSNYPQPLLRCPGDIDFYCPPQHYQQALELIASAWHATYEGHPKGHHQAFVHNGTHYELHNRIGQLYQKRKNRQWQQLTDNSPRATVSIDGHDIATLSPTIHVFYLFLHLYNHLLIAGVGLKQVCDVAMMLHGNKAQIDRDELCRLLSDFGLEKAFRALGSILTAHLGLPSDEFPYALTPTDQRYGAYLLEAIFRHGSFGFHHRRYHKVSLAHTMESLMIQARHVFRFAPLSYSYTLHWALHAVRSKLCRTMK
jgi:hypothetical protein